jgi:hypothetical protein
VEKKLREILRYGRIVRNRKKQDEEEIARRMINVYRTPTTAQAASVGDGRVFHPAGVTTAAGRRDSPFVSQLDDVTQKFWRPFRGDVKSKKIQMCNSGYYITRYFVIYTGH